MKLFIVPKPVLNHEMVILSYCFRFRRADEYLSDQPARVLDGVINLPCLTILEEVGLNGFTNGEALFVPLTKFTLLSDVTMQCTQPPDKIIFLLDEGTPPEEMFIDCIRKLKDAGFRFAVEKIKDYDQMRPIIDLCDFIMISCKNGDAEKKYNEVSRKYPKHTFIATDVNDMETFERIRYSGFDQFEGRFYNIPVTKGHNTIAPIKINRMQLLNLVRDPDFEISEVVKIVSRDLSLSISLLKFVNSPYLGLSQKIKNIQHAVAMLGQNEVRKWVTTAASGALADDKPAEITRLSLLRAKFAENLARQFQMGIQAPGLFLMGLFSVLDVVMDMSMYDALKIINVSEKIQDALVHREGDYADVLRFILSYEAADWNEAYRLAIIRELDIEKIFEAYINTLRWYDSLDTSY